MRAECISWLLQTQLPIASSGSNIVIDTAANVTVTLFSVNEFAGLAGYRFVSNKLIISLQYKEKAHERILPSIQPLQAASRIFACFSCKARIV